MAALSASNSNWRTPNFQLLANGNILWGAVRIEVTSNNHYAADCFSGEVSLSADPNYGLSWWASQADVQIEAKMSLDQSSWQSIIIGRIDHLQFDLTTNCVRFDGRDFTADLIDAKTQDTFANQTSSQIATTLAARHGLTADVQSTSTLVGTYYQLEHDRITHDNFSRQTTEWDLLIYLAQQEGYDVWVSGTTLHFKPAGSTGSTYTVNYTQPSPIPALNVSRLHMERSLTLAKDIQVTVKSTNLKNGKAYTRIVKGHNAKSPGASNSNTQNYVFVKPGLTPDQALQYAQQRLTELSKHERVISLEMAGEANITPRDMIQLVGTNSEFDQLYYLDEIHRCMDFEQGFVQNMRAKNTSPRTQTTVL